MPALYPLMYFVTLGWNNILTKTVKNEKVRSLIYRVLTVLLGDFAICLLGIFNLALKEIKGLPHEKLCGSPLNLSILSIKEMVYCHGIQKQASGFDHFDHQEQEKQTGMLPRSPR